tara:strand:+ start:424 stop:1209 length:786 start_codon:yes stop_codon:yes gene_type:complete
MTQNKDLSNNLKNLCDTIAKLRDPVLGCPWDKEQDFNSLAPFVIEEAYEVLEAITNQDWVELETELGDLLLQTVFHAQIASEIKLFDMSSIIKKVNQKMIDRHPHVFITGTPNRSIEQQRTEWENVKQKERSKKNKSGVFDDIAKSLPGLKRSIKIQQRAAERGFDWDRVEKIYVKLDEEIQELKESTNQDNVREEVGDILFTVVNLARHLNVDPEDALFRSNTKFSNRLEKIESISKQENIAFKDLSEIEKNRLWEEVKK